MAPDSTGDAAPGHPRGDQPLRIRVSATAEEIRHVRGTVRRFAERHGAQRPYDVALAVQEACANVALHAYAGRPVGDLRVLASCERHRVVVRICDDGAGLRPRPDSPGLGLGLPLMARLADTFDVRDRDGQGTLVCMAFAAGPPGEAAA